MSNKFAEWMISNDKKQRGVAAKLAISTSTLNQIIKRGLMPGLILAYKIEQYTQGAITLYDWLDMEAIEQNMKTKKPMLKQKNQNK